MDWAGAIDLNRTALYRIVAALFALAGLEHGGSVAALPRHLRNHVLRLLRPAESAVRRLVIIAARNMNVDVPPARSVILGPEPRTHTVKPEPATKAKNLALPLIDALPDLSFRPRRRRSKSFPRISIIGVTEPRPIPAGWIPSPDDPVGAERLCRRLAALKRVLDDLDSQARRFARWRARRDLGRTRRFNPMRPGRPPGHRKRAFHEVDDVLRECHSLAIWAQREDTS